MLKHTSHICLSKVWFSIHPVILPVIHLIICPVYSSGYLSIFTPVTNLPASCHPVLDPILHLFLSSLKKEDLSNEISSIVK